MDDRGHSSSTGEDIGQSKPHHISVLRHFLPWSSQGEPHKREMQFPVISIGLSTFFINVLSLALPIALIQTYDRILPSKSYETLIALGVIVLIALIMEICLRLIRSYILDWSGAVFEHKTTCAALEHLSKADPAAIDKIGLGNVLNCFDKIPYLREFYSYQPVFLLLIDLPFMVIYLALIMYLGGWLVLPILAIVGIYILAVWFESGMMSPSVNKYHYMVKKRVNYIIETLKGIHTIKSLGSESFFLRRYDRLNKTIWQYAHFINLRMGMIFNQMITLSQLLTIIVATTGALLFLNGHLALGAFSACILLAYRLIYPIQRSITFLQKMNDILYYQRTVDSLFNIPLLSPSTMMVKEIKGKIDIEDVTLHFPHSNDPIFKNMSLKIGANSCVSISADLHAGQTTIVNLIAGFVKPDTGKILIDGAPPSDISEDQYNQVLSYIPTNSEIFEGTIRDNLTFFGAYSDKKAEEIGQKLGIDSIIKYLPFGYETPLFDNAADPISPGVKQRITIARALASDAKIILFDHADSTLDLEGLEHLIAYLKSLKKKKTIVLFTNNTTILNLADKHYKIANKKIDEVKI